MKYVLFAIVAVIIFALGYVSGQFFAFTGFDVVNGTAPTMETTDTSTGQTSTQKETVPINTADIPPAQQELLDKYGVDANNITPEMVACAEAKLGAARIEEIKNGATPSFTESIQLYACYSTN